MPSKNFKNALNFVLAVVLLFSVSCAGTVAVHPVKSRTASYSGNRSTSGLERPEYNKNGQFIGFRADNFYIKRYSERVAKYGDRMNPPVDDPKDGVTKFLENYWLVTKAVVDANLQGATLERMGAEPKPEWKQTLEKFVNWTRGI